MTALERAVKVQRNGARGVRVDAAARLSGTVLPDSWEWDY